MWNASHPYENVRNDCGKLSWCWYKCDLMMVFASQISFLRVPPYFRVSFIKHSIHKDSRKYGILVYPKKQFLFIRRNTSCMFKEKHLGAIWETSKRHLWGIWEAYWRLSGHGGSRRSRRQKVMHLLAKTSRVLLKCWLYLVFVRVGVTKACKWQWKMSDALPRISGTAQGPFTETVRTPQIH